MIEAEREDDRHVVVSEDDARSGVTGHHVRYVLAFGLAGIVIAYLVIGGYYYLADLLQALSRAHIDAGTLVALTIPVALAAVAIVLLLGLWNMVSPNTSQTFMRWRVGLQFIALMLIMAALYLTAK